MGERTPAGNSGNRHNRLDSLFSSLAKGDRRRLLSHVAAQSSEAVAVDELAAVLTTGVNSSDERSPDEKGAALGLHHIHLPSLAEAGLLEYDADAEVVRATDHPAYRDRGISTVIAGETVVSPGSLDALFDALADERRRAVLDVLSHQTGPIHVETLARELEAKERGIAESDVPVDEIEQLLMGLYHVHLPRLAEAGLVEYDSDADTVAYEGHPALRVPWVQSVLEPAFRPSLTGETRPDGIGEIEGSEQVISFRQWLCDRADEELFCMFTDTGLLKAGCLTRVRDAARERDVDVYLGTRDPTVREYIEENAPEVILWEPSTGWLNLPATGDRVGRLLMADREAVMLGTLLGDRRDDVHREQAIVGEGKHNTLVTMICQLLNPHLAEVDAGTDDIETRLPL